MLLNLNFSSRANSKEYKLNFLLSHKQNSKLFNQLLSWYRVKEKEIEDKTYRRESGTDQGNEKKLQSHSNVKWNSNDTIKIEKNREL